MEIPSDLIAAVAERRVIPFVGAGFSSTVGLPNWDQLLAKLASETEGSLPYEDLKKYTGGDNLQIAEYLYLKSDQRIGPLRHVIERGMPTGVDATLSTAHIELLNLNAPQIYTTNYDDLLETTYRSLDVPVNVVALGRDVAVAGQQATQIVKYHGDLRHEETLVLTESSYFKRLDFESAMDVKFRADLLGRSVLFMGYSFRDINIRLIWFKLNQMMEDIPTADRRQSYIVRLERNPVLEELYEAVGLKTLVLDSPDTEHRRRPTRWGRTPLGMEAEITSVGSFLASLSSIAASRRLEDAPGAQLFASREMVEQAEKECEEAEHDTESDSHQKYFGLNVCERLLARRIPPALEQRVDAVASKALQWTTARWSLARKVIEFAQEKGPSPELSWYVGQILAREIPTDTRDEMLKSEIVDWSMVWASFIDEEKGSKVLDRLEKEIKYSKDEGADADIAYTADLALRLVRGWIETPSEAFIARAKELLAAAAQIYPAVDSIPETDGPPELEKVLIQVAERQAYFQEASSEA